MRTTKIHQIAPDTYVCMHADAESGFLASAIIHGSTHNVLAWIERVASGQVCAWCDRQDGTVREGEVSHGVCLEHKAQLIAEARHARAKAELHDD